MTRTRIRSVIATLASVALALPASIHAQVQLLARDTTINVSITRVGRMQADRMTFYVGIEGLADNVANALERLSVKIKAVQDTIKRVSPTTVLDAPMIVGVVSGNQSTYPPPPGPVTIARGAIRVTVSKFTEIAALQSAATAAGVSVTGNAAFDAAQVESVWKAKISEATDAAREAAVIAATAQGYKLGSLLSMTLSGGPQNNGYQQPPQLNFDARGYSGAPMGSPDVPVNATVSVTYLLVRK